MSQFTVRRSLPASGNKLYNNGNAGGWSRCIDGSPTKEGLNVLANCVGWACSRFNEIYNVVPDNDSNAADDNQKHDGDADKIVLPEAI